MAWHSIVTKGNLGILLSKKYSELFPIGHRSFLFLFFLFFFINGTGIGLIPPMCTMHIQHGFLECSRLVMFFCLSPSYPVVGISDM